MDSFQKGNQVVLASAQVLRKSKERFHKCRVLFNSGSHVTLSTEA